MTKRPPTQKSTRRVRKSLSDNDLSTVVASGIGTSPFQLVDPKLVPDETDPTQPPDV